MRAVAVALFVLAVASPAWGGKRAVVVGERGYVDVLAGPDREQPKVGRLVDGAEAEVLEERGGWARLRHLGGEGWVMSQSLKSLPEAPPDEARAPARGVPSEVPSGTPQTRHETGPEAKPQSEYLSQYADEPELPPVDAGSSLVTMVSGLLLVLALLAGLTYAARGLAGRRFPSHRSGRGIQVLATRALGGRHGLVLVEVGGLVWLLSQGPEGVALVAEIRDPEALRRLNERYGFLETAFETELRRQLDLESGEEAESPHREDTASPEPSPEERLAALRGGRP